MKKMNPPGVGSERRSAGSARIVKFNVRIGSRCDRRLTSGAAVFEFYETGIEAPRGVNWKAATMFAAPAELVPVERHRGG